MSVITDVAIIASDTESEAIAVLGAFLPNPLGKGAALDAGTKVGSFAAWGGAYNYLDWDDLAKVIKGAPWRLPDWVTVIRHGESDDVPARFSLADLP